MICQEVDVFGFEGDYGHMIVDSVMTIDIIGIVVVNDIGLLIGYVRSMPLSACLPMPRQRIMSTVNVIAEFTFKWVLYTPTLADMLI
jgi:hypothetical protein